jgi:hypothetical protein
MPQQIEVKGLDELIHRMTAYPVELAKVVVVSMNAALIALWEKVPAYPPQDPGARYRRTGMLGRSLGSSQQGGAQGSPSVFNVKSLGSGNVEGVFGTNLEYAEYVIGENQAGMHSSNWWNIRTIAERAADKIEKIWQQCGDLLAQFLEGRK